MDYLESLKSMYKKIKEYESDKTFLKKYWEFTQLRDNFENLHEAYMMDLRIKRIKKELDEMEESDGFTSRD